MSEYLMYLRKSRQDNESESVEEVLAKHERLLQEYSLKAFGYRIQEANIYREVVSGETIEDRPQINLLFNRMQNENIKGILVVDTARLTRGDLLDCGKVVHLFKYTNTLIITPFKTFNLEDKFDRKFFESELTKGNDYLEYTKEILERGRSASAHEGNYIGGVAPYGYNKIRIGKSPTLAINHEQAKVVKLIYSLYLNENLGYQEIANRLNALGFKSQKGSSFIGKVIYEILHNPVYIGKIKYKHRPVTKKYENGKLTSHRFVDHSCELIDGKHEAIVTEEEFLAVQNLKGRNVTMPSTKKLTNIFSGILKCKKCGKSIGRKSSNIGDVKRDRYFCRNFKHCDCVSEQSSIVDKAIIESLKATLENYEVEITDGNEAIATNYKMVVESLEKELDKIESKQLQLYDFLENGIYTTDVFVARNKALDLEREKTKKAIQVAKDSIPTLNDFKQKIVYLHQAIEMLEDSSIDARIKNNFLKQFIDVIYFYKSEKGTRYKDGGSVELEIRLK